MTAHFSWDPDLLDNLNVESSVKPAVLGAQKSEGHLEANDPSKEANPVP